MRTFFLGKMSNLWYDTVRMGVVPLHGFQPVKWIRWYLFVLSSLRAFILGKGMARGLNAYFPDGYSDLHIGLFALLFVTHWIIVMFYTSVRPWTIGTVLMLNSAFALYGRFYVLLGAGTLQQALWFGNMVTLLLDGFFLVLLIASGSLCTKAAKKTL